MSVPHVSATSSKQKYIPIDIHIYNKPCHPSLPQSQHNPYVNKHSPSSSHVRERSDLSKAQTQWKSKVGENYTNDALTDARNLLLNLGIYGVIPLGAFQNIRNNTSIQSMPTYYIYTVSQYSTTMAKQYDKTKIIRIYGRSELRNRVFLEKLTSLAS
jgi:hypothetical protein